MGDELEVALEELETTEGWKAGPSSSFRLDPAKEGDFVVAFAKADGSSVDKDGHITDLEAIPTKSVPVSAYGHSSWPEKGARLPVGRTEIGPDSATKTAIASGSFFLETTHGRDTYGTVKGLGELGEWSYGYKILAAARTDQKTAGSKPRPVIRLRKLDIKELSPVLIGAGNDTRTLAIKSDETGPLAGLPFAEDFDRVLIDVEAIVSRSKSLRDLRLKDGRELSEANRARLVRLRDGIGALDELRGELEELIARTDRSDPAVEKAASALFLEYQQTIGRLDEMSIRVG